MRYSYLVGKIAGDKFNQKLGKIIAIEMHPRETRQIKDNPEDKLEEHLIILVHRFFKKDVGFIIDTNRILKVEGNFVWLDITKEQFNKALKTESKKLIKTPKGVIKEIDEWKAEYSTFLAKRDN